MDAVKRSLRRQLRQTMMALPTTTKQAGGRAIANHLMDVLDGLGGGPPVVAFFASTVDELDTRPLDSLLRSRGFGRAVPRIRAGGELMFHEVYVPVHDLPLDAHGIPTPPATSTKVDLAECGLVCVPGLGFDDDGGRIGYGRGYYDRALQGVPLARVIGLFLDEQRVERVPMFETDVRMPRLCTPARGVVVVDKGPPSR
ncbi:MAG: 5-formyltetrahydrofolate cyclo-ligase [Deltaproteobacteria bacterium]|nr:5-formyltetrahydrofolate cyclo-ligase [Deltaproteobacteria bacterium]